MSQYYTFYSEVSDYTYYFFKTSNGIIYIAEIFYHFFTDKQRIIVYICDTADARHQARARKFGAWFDEFKHGQFVKVNTTIVDYSSLVYLNALILHIENPYFVEIIDAFRKVTGGYTQDK